MPGSRVFDRSPDDQTLFRLLIAGRSLVAELEPERVLNRLVEAARELTGARHAAIGVFAEAAAPSETVLRMAIEIDGEIWGHLYLSDKADGEFDEADRQILVALADWAGVALRNATLHRRADTRAKELEGALHAFQAAVGLAQATGGEARPADLLELIAERTRELVSAAGVMIQLDGLERPVLAADAGDALEQATSGRVLSVPLSEDGAPIGVIQAVRGADDVPFTVRDEHLLAATAMTAGAAIATARSAERTRLRSGLESAEAERRRWAREIHDDTLQSLGGLRLLLSSARRRGDVESLRAALDAAVAHVDCQVVNLRSLLTDLRPAALDELGLAPALHALCRRAANSGVLRVETSIRLTEDAAGGRLDPEIETAVYRLIQESLTNAIRHARAARVQVELGEAEGEVRFSVADDGGGFDVSASPSGFGLIGMRERVALAGGRLEVRSGRSGTVVSVALPAIREGAGDSRPRLAPEVVRASPSLATRSGADSR